MRLNTLRRGLAICLRLLSTVQFVFAAMNALSGDYAKGGFMMGMATWTMIVALEEWQAGGDEDELEPPDEHLREALHWAVTSREIAWNALDEMAAPDGATATQLKATARRARDESAESAALAPASDPGTVAP